MDAPAKRLAATKTDDDTRRARSPPPAASSSSWTPSSPTSPSPAQGGGGGGGPRGKPGPRADGIPTAAQVKMLKMLQQEVNLRTEELDELKDRGKELTEKQQAEVGRLDEEQGSIADLARDLAQPKKDDGEE